MEVDLRGFLNAEIRNPTYSENKNGFGSFFTIRPNPNLGLLIGYHLRFSHDKCLLWSKELSK